MVTWQLDSVDMGNPRHALEYQNDDGQLGRDRYDSNAVTGGVSISF